MQPQQTLLVNDRAHCDPDLHPSSRRCTFPPFEIMHEHSTETGSVVRWSRRQRNKEIEWLTVEFRDVMSHALRAITILAAKLKVISDWGSLTFIWLIKFCQTKLVCFPSQRAHSPAPGGKVSARPIDWPLEEIIVFMSNMALKRRERSHYFDNRVPLNKDAVIMPAYRAEGLWVIHWKNRLRSFSRAQLFSGMRLSSPRIQNTWWSVKAVFEPRSNPENRSLILLNMLVWGLLQSNYGAINIMWLDQLAACCFEFCDGTKRIDTSLMLTCMAKNLFIQQWLRFCWYSYKMHSKSAASSPTEKKISNRMDIVVAILQTCMQKSGIAQPIHVLNRI